MKKVSTAAAKQIRNFSEQKLTIGVDEPFRLLPSHFQPLRMRQSLPRG